MAGHADLVPLTLTFVEYEKGDALGKILAYTSLLPVFIGFGLGVAIIVRRELSTMMLLVGLILDERVNSLLKKMIKQPRPPRNVDLAEAGAAAGEAHIWSEYGMPSSHSQFMFFFATFMTFWLLMCVRSRERPEVYLTKKITSGVKLVASLGMFSVASVVAFGRVYLRYHTFEQVKYGAAAGVLSGSWWFFFTYHVVQPRFIVVEQWWLARLLLIKDSSDIDDVLLAEYEALQNHREHEHAQATPPSTASLKGAKSKDQ